MKNYFIIAFPELRERLQSASIGFCDLDMDGTQGVVVEEGEIERAIHTIGAKILSEKNSSIEGITSLELMLENGERIEPSVVYVVTVHDWDGNGKRRFVQIAEEVLLPVIKRDIDFSVPHKKAHTPNFDEKFHIFLWSTPQKNGDLVEPPMQMWGIDVSCQDSGFKSSGLGIPIMDETSDWVVGELVENNLYVHHDICHHGRDDEVRIFRRLCEEVVNIFLLSSEELITQKEGRSKNAYIKHRLSSIDRVIGALDKQIVEDGEKVQRLQNELINTIRRVEDNKWKRERLASIDIKKPELATEYEQEFAALSQISGVEKIVMFDDFMIVYVEHIYITPEEHPDKTIDIGKFKMVIYLDGDDECIKFFNLTRRGTGDNYNIIHPHVADDGSPCLGNISEMLPELLAEYEYSAAIQLGIQYLRSVNLDDSMGGDVFEHWPLKGGVEK